jgi:hypothetical protein
MYNYSNEQPGRLVSLILFAPILLYKGYKYDDIFLIFCSLLLFIWDLYYIINRKSSSVIGNENILKPLPLTELLKNEKNGNIFIE